MFGVTNYLEFVLAVILFLCIPGPGNLALVTSTTKGGKLGGMAATLGIMTGDQVLLWLAVAGVAAILAANPLVFDVVQFFGAGYLVWLGWRLMIYKIGDAAVIQIRPADYFQQSFFITLLNPKAIVFYMAFLPLFIDSANHHGMVTFASLALTVAALTFIYGLILVMMTYYLAERMQSSPSLTVRMHKIAGICLVGFGIKLAFSR